MNIDGIVLLVLVGLIVIMMKFCTIYKKPSEESKLIVYKAVLTSMVSAAQVMLYFMLIAMTGVIWSEENPIARGIASLILFLMAIMGSVYIFRTFLRDVQSKGISYRKSVWFWLILLDLFILLLIAGSLINYAVLNLFPDWFALPDETDLLENLLKNKYLAGFECIHYTFSLITTNGSPILIAAHPFTKVLEMVEMLVFYVVYGCWLTNLMSKD